MNNLPNIDNYYNLENVKIDFFWQNGFVVLKNVLSKSEISAYRDEIKKVAEERNKDKDKEFGGAFYQALNIRYDSKGVEKFCLSKRLGKIAADLMKVDAVRIFHEQAIFKHPGDTKSYWHQDQFFWPLDTNLHIGLWMPLIDCNKDMGIMRFVKNSHTMGDLMGISINENTNILGKKSINLPLGEVKISRKVKSLDIIIRTCMEVQMLTQNKKRVFEKHKSEYSLRTVNSIIQSYKHSKNLKNLEVKFTVIDHNSEKENL